MKKVKYIILGLLVAAPVSTKAQTTANLTFEQVVAKLKAAPDAQILDARSNEEFLQNHIKDAISADAQAADFDQTISALLKNKPTFIYAIANNRSSILAKQLRQKGFTQVYEIPGGLSNWIGSGNPIVSVDKKRVPLTKTQYVGLTNSSPLVIVDFASRFCGACKKLAPVLDSLKTTAGFTPKIVTVEDYDNPQLARELNIHVLPTLVLYQNNKEVWRHSGFISTVQIQQVVNSKTRPVSAAN